MMKSKPVIFSGIQPSGNLTIGGYLGALRNWVKLQHEFDSLYCIVDLHAITVRQDAKTFAERCLSFMALYLAAGIDPEVSTVFLQSTVPEYTELAWLLNCHTYMGELGRMTQFKAKTAGKTDKNIGVGLFDYPVLMASDILLYGSDLVPVGADQKQHLELTRDLAIRMNHYYGDIFTVPEPYIPKVGARVMSLQNPNDKMSKSDPNANNYISLIDPPDVISKKIKKAVMDSIQGITYDPDNRPGVANLLTMYGALTDEDPAAVAERYADKGNAALKNDLAEVIISKLEPFQSKYHDLMNDHNYLRELLIQGKERASARAVPRLRTIRTAMGFYDIGK